MHIVILGCGRVGSALAQTMDREGHSVAVVDMDAESFRKLPPDFGGNTVVGIGFDRDTLIDAGIAHAQAFAACSSGDNTNIISARVARETFGVENVVARIYDPRRAEVYQRLGIPTVASVAWATDQMLRRLMPRGAQEEWTDASGTLALAEMPVHPDWLGRLVRQLQDSTGARIAFLTRFGQALLPTRDTVLQDGDIVHVLLMRSDEEHIAEVFMATPESQS
ncbi:MAG: TrkA family potassium uptake protein [Candidatus Nanopelagicales bacterium]